MGILRRLLRKPQKAIRDVFLFSSETGLRDKLMELGAKGVLDGPYAASDFIPSADKALGLNGALVRAVANRGTRTQRVDDNMSTKQWHRFLEHRFADCPSWRSWGASTPYTVYVIVVVFD
jgi:hypothetical protein